MYGLDPFEGADVDGNGGIDPADHEARAPIPSCMTLGLANEVPAHGLDRVYHVGNGIGELFGQLGSTFYRGVEEEGNSVVSLTSRCREVETISFEHIIATTDLDFIDKDSSKGIYPFDIQKSCDASRRACSS